MHARRLGASGLTVSPLALGTAMWGNAIAPEIAGDLLETFLDAGGTLVDTAHTYGNSEQTIGELLHTRVDREELTLLTKGGITGEGTERVLDASRGALMRQLDASLMSLRTDHVDVWMVHRFDPSVPVEETVSALVWAHTTGRARYIGVSNHSAWQAVRVHALLERAGVPMIAVESPWSLCDRRVEGELTEAVAALSLGFLAYSPLARGILTGKYRSGIPTGSRGASDPRVREQLTDRTRGVVEAVATAADGLGASPAQVALAWLLAQPELDAAIIGARTSAQLTPLLAAADLQLPDEIIDALADVSA